MTELIQINQYPVSDVLSLLLKDKTTGDNIIFATDTYSNYGYTERDCMSDIAVIGFSSCDIQPRVLKAQVAQNERTRKKAEVFTPTWICNLMNNHLDSEWFGSENIFNRQQEREWKETTEKIPFPKNKDWKKYVDSRRLEITCGEAPYIVSRYDATTGELIPVERRIGLLDRKLRIVGENTETEEEWLKWTVRAFQSVYGYEFQGDNLLIARINLIVTFCDYLYAKWQRKATKDELRKIANIISWNVWQMDGLSSTIPFSTKEENYVQMSFLEKEADKREEQPLFCKVQDWRGKYSVTLKNLKEKDKRGINMKFDYVIGNPPFQEEAPGTSTSDKPIYHYFMDSAYQIADKVELITPGRFLFNAGATPNDWNNKMLADEHLKVLFFEHNSSKVFSNTDIKGGIAITYRDVSKKYGSIQVFSPFSELNSIKEKAAPKNNSDSLVSIIYNQNKFDLDELYKVYPEYSSIIGSNGKDKRFRNNIFDKIPLFTEEKTNEDDIAVFGLHKTKRVWRYFPKRFIDLEHENLFKWKVFVPRANGSGAIGEVLSTPLCGTPLCGYTQSFIGIGAFDNEEEANNCMKYIKTKFSRTMLGILKITQDNPPEKWVLVPLQNFTANSDIDWNESIPEIDNQLYRKYNLSQEEIDFIETHVKEMT